MKKTGLIPLAKYPGAKKPWKCKCNTCGKTVRPQYGKVASGEVTGCAYCSKKRVDEDDAIRVMEEAGLTPLERFQTVHTPWKSQCRECKQVVRPHFATVQRGSGCRFCAPYGLDLNKPATLYLIEQLELRASKIGIAESSSDRIDLHIRHGWRVVKVWQFKTGELAGVAENAVLDFFRNELKLPPFLGPSDMPQGGYSETVSSAGITLERVEAVVRNFAL
jgi:Zn finger protein HypA/HybF involved in hydrogenase expression